MSDPLRLTAPLKIKLSLFKPTPVALEEALEARERRQAAQVKLRARLACPLVSFSMNIAGPFKYTPLTDLAFSWGLERIIARMGTPLELEIVRQAAGAEALLAYPGPAERLKATAQAIEDEAPVGRLFDIDVLDGEGRKLSRPEPRPCVVCGGPAMACARSRAHGLEAVQKAMGDLLLDHAAGWLADRAVEALVEEARLTPKPGLVDQANAGAHRDMDLGMLEASAECLRPYFKLFVRAGAETPDDFPALQKIGVEAEAAMLDRTCGVNTHRGAIYSFGLLLGALGASLVAGEVGEGEGDVFARAGRLARGSHPSIGLGELSHGGLALRRYGAGGARAEAAGGFPTARAACRVLREEGPLGALLFLMARCEDTNVLYRGGEEGLRFVRRGARLILRLPGAWRAPAARWLDRAMIRRNLSPGGCADLLSLALFMEGVGLVSERA